MSIQVIPKLRKSLRRSGKRTKLYEILKNASFTINLAAIIKICRLEDSIPKTTIRPRKVKDLNQSSTPFSKAFLKVKVAFSSYTRPAVPPGDIELTVEVTLDEVDSGTKRALTYRTDDVCPNCDGIGVVQLTGKRTGQCPQCHGRGTVPTPRKVEVKIPAGISDGKKLRVPGGGSRGSGGKAGDLYVITKSATNSNFRRSGDNLESTVEVDYLDAVLGGPISVPTLSSIGTVAIPAGSQSGQIIRLKGKGLTSMKGGKGDLHAKIKITTPKEINPEEKDLLEKIRNLRSKN